MITSNMLREKDKPQFRIGSRGHFCGGCDRQKFLHAGCVADGSYTVSPDDPLAVASKAARVSRLQPKSITSNDLIITARISFAEISQT